MAVQQNAAYGRDPCGHHDVDGGKREGMSRQKTGTNSPAGRGSGDKVRKLQRRLCVAAKRSPGRRFHALYDRMYRGDVLDEAWRRVRKNRGAAGVDKQTLAAIEEQGVARFLMELGDDLREGRYLPQAVRRAYIPKADGKQRPLGIPTVRDRVAQTAAKIVLEPIFEADFKPCSYGFRPRRSTTQALERIRILGRPRGGGDHVLDADITDFFGSLDHELLMGQVERRVSDRRVLKLVWLGAKDVRVLIRKLNLVLRGWGSHFRTGNAAVKFGQLDDYVTWRLHRFMVKRKGRNLKAGEASAWTQDFFCALGLHRLRGTVKYPEAA